MKIGRGGYRTNAGRKGCWRHGETQTIRVPIALRDELLEIGKQLDQGEHICQATYSQLQAILNAWQAKCDAESVESGEFQKVGQLIAEIQQILSTEEAFSHGNRRGRGRHCGQFGRNQDFHEDIKSRRE